MQATDEDIEQVDRRGHDFAGETGLFQASNPYLTTSHALWPDVTTKSTLNLHAVKTPMSS
jgi:hypothetical protein